MTFSGDDLEVLAALVADSWRSAADRDWSAPAGSLDWSCTWTAYHVVDTVLAPAFFLASRQTDDYRPAARSPSAPTFAPRDWPRPSRPQPAS